ncbi:hypothetical protein OH76DRAFT_475901 [Lentinus brumalis]|uniref:Uncharacterized protein n=1 Tax=Lentinus brumalis TaxID=2498619 RepID=A0A371CI59_9APHY|nr:hypothetical protein OH76DRAFT_475901 [Polyporus brumalis]
MRTGGRGHPAVVRVVRQCLSPIPNVVNPLKLLLATWKNKVEGGNYAGGGYGSDLPPGLHLTGPPAHGGRRGQVLPVRAARQVEHDAWLRFGTQRPRLQSKEQCHLRVETRAPSGVANNDGVLEPETTIGSLRRENSLEDAPAAGLRETSIPPWVELRPPLDLAAAASAHCIPTATRTRETRARVNVDPTHTCETIRAAQMAARTQ